MVSKTGYSEILGVDRIYENLEEGIESFRDNGEDFDNYLEAEFKSDQAEPVGDNLTNELVEVPDGTIIKRYEKNPAMSYVQAGGRILSGGFDRQDQEDRIQNEKAFREFLGNINYDVKYPEILDTEEEYVKLEKLDGQNLISYLNENPDDAYDTGSKVGEFLSEVHNEDCAVTELRLTNFMRSEKDDQLRVLDGEYFVEDADTWEKKMDVITIASSAKQVDQQAYWAFRKGFEEEYGDIDGFSDLTSSVTAPLHAKFLEGDSFLEGDTRRCRNQKVNTNNTILDRI